MGKGYVGILSLLLSAGLYAAFSYPNWRYNQAIDKYNQGVELQGSKQWDQAESAYKESLEIHELAEAHLNLGQVYSAKDWTEGARQETQKALELFDKGGSRAMLPDQNVGKCLSISHYNLGVIDVDEIGDKYLKNEITQPAQFEKALQPAREEFSQAAKIDPSNADAQGAITNIDRQVAMMQQLQQMQKASDEWTRQMQMDWKQYMSAMKQLSQSVAKEPSP